MTKISLWYKIKCCILTYFFKGDAMKIEKTADDLIIVRLRCTYNTNCGRQCDRIVKDITIKKNDLVTETNRKHQRIHFKNTLLSALARLGINPERILCDNHTGDDNNETDKNSDCAGIAVIDSNTKNFRRE